MGKPGSIITTTDLIKHGFSYPDWEEYNLVSRVILGWDTFLKEPHFYKEWWFDLEKSSDNLGYQTLGRQDEDVEIFNVKSGLRQIAENNGFDFKHYEQWLTDLALLRDYCLSYSLDIVEALCVYLEKDFSALEKSFGSYAEPVLQLAKYPYDKFNFLIEPHQDNSFLTILLYENFSGLMFGKNVDTPHLKQDNKVLVFFGEQAESFSPKLKPMIHGIKNNSFQKSLSLSFSLSNSSLQEVIS